LILGLGSRDNSTEKPCFWGFRENPTEHHRKCGWSRGPSPCWLMAMMMTVRRSGLHTVPYGRMTTAHWRLRVDRIPYRIKKFTKADGTVRSFIWMYTRIIWLWVLFYTVYIVLNIFKAIRKNLNYFYG
jgi:hypothetical protein